MCITQLLADDRDRGRRRPVTFAVDRDHGERVFTTLGSIQDGPITAGSLVQDAILIHLIHEGCLRSLVIEGLDPEQIDFSRPIYIVTVQVMSFLKAFQSIWDMALILFGFHLLVLGYLAFKSGYVPQWLGVFLLLASVGYIVDGLGKTLSSGYNLNIAQFTFIGEVLQIFWLLWKGIKGFDWTLEARK